MKTLRATVLHPFVSLIAAAFAVAGCADAESDHTHDEATETSAFEQAYLEKDDAKQDGSNCSGVRVPDRNGFGKRIALTFDDGPNPETTPLIIETLRKYGAPAAFFINGSKARGEAEQALLQEMVADPDFIVANHTWSHENLAEVSRTEVGRQIDRTQAIIDAAGEETNYFRFPYGSSTCATAEAVRSRGLTITGWHIDSADWCYAKNDGYCAPRTFRYVDSAFRRDMAGYVMSQVRSTQGGVLLFHDIHGYTAATLDGLLAQLVSEGFTFTSLDDTSTFPRLNGTTAPPVVTKFIGDVCVTDGDCGFSIWNEAGKCHAAGFCTIPCEGYCPDQSGKAATFCVQDPLQTVPTGICVPQATSANGHCADLPETLDASAERYIGSSTAQARSAEVCMPASPTP
ncbi:MAG: polysaccharide deacetylase family protein [Bradymonadia bacterium]|jgi:peptidoglycan/xylan/chitin deacetylase (PgdA/CDA1 family)